MAHNPVREHVLAEVKARRRAAGQKLSRLKHAGVNTGIEGFDPRRSNSQLESMNTRQLRSHLNQLNTFTSRSNGYVPGLKGVPLSASTWRAYQRAEKLNNKRAADFYNSIKDLSIPGLGLTVAERLKKLREGTLYEGKAAPRAGDYSTFGNFDRSAANITGQESLKKLLTQMMKRNDPKYLEREARLQRRILNKMLARTGNKDLIPLVRDMADEEVITLAQYTDFLPTLEGSYAMSKSTSTDRPRWQSSVFEDNEEKIHDWTEWAHNHFTEKKESEQDSDDTPTTKTGRDRFGRFAREGEYKPAPEFARDERGRFKPRTPRFTPGTGEFNPDYS